MVLFSESHLHDIRNTIFFQECTQSNQAVPV